MRVSKAKKTANRDEEKSQCRKIEGGVAGMGSGEVGLVSTQFWSVL